MIPKEKQAAQLLEGKELTDGWIVVENIPKETYNTGGTYSCCYKVRKGDSIGFLKAFDYSSASKVGGADEVKNILNAFMYEREILKKCSEHQIKNVIQFIGHGEYEIKEAIQYPKALYLILEFASNGDIRDAVNQNRLTIEWKLRSLHQLALGLSNLHKILIAHQDIKPSNIVSTVNNITKIVDFGSAANMNYAGESPKYLEKDVCGTWEYAPPDLLYAYNATDLITRRVGCDLYLLGSMITFYFTDMSMTALIRSNLSDELCWTNSKQIGNFEVVLPFVKSAFELALIDLSERIKEDDIREKIVLIVKYLCQPDPNERGHEKNRKGIGPKFNLERFVSMFDWMAKIYEIRKGIKYIKS